MRIGGLRIGQIPPLPKLASIRWLKEREHGSLWVSQYGDRADILHHVCRHDSGCAELGGFRCGRRAILYEEVSHPMGGRSRRCMHLAGDSSDHVLLVCAVDDMTVVILAR